MPRPGERCRYHAGDAMPNAEPNPFDSPTVDGAELGRQRRTLTRKYWITLAVIACAAILPLVGLRIYISQTGDYDARWQIIRFMPLILGSWILLGLVVIYGLVQWARRLLG